MKMLVKIVLLVALCAFVNSSEPECSRFHYEEKTLEKMIKTEIYVDKIKSETDIMQQKMSEKLDGIQEDWEKTKNELNDANAGSTKTVEEIKDKVESLSTMQAVAFLAHDIKNTLPSNGETMIFSTTQFDVGSSYNNETGIFVAPIGGIYMFTLQLCIISNRYVNFEIATKKGPILKGLFIDDGSNYTGCQTATTIAELDIKEHVWIKCRSSSSGTDLVKDASIWNSFSGALISAVTK